MMLVLVLLAIALAVVAAIGIIGFVDVAFHPPERSANGEGQGRSSSRGGTTFDWFSATADRLTRSLVAARRDASETRGANGFGFGAAERQRGDRAREPIAAGFCLTRTQVTPPEALEIAAFLRKTQPAERVESVRLAAAANARTLSEPERLSGAVATVRCPLTCDDGTCLAMPVRPIHCRMHCALFGHDVADDGTRAASDGAEAGFRQAMIATGLADELCELNGALATALSVPDAAERWSCGENPFDRCAPQSR